ncbi:hypothetical protein ACHAQA_003401 [Verticillium albo-atrum]
MPQDPNLYGQPAPKRRKNNSALTSSLDFTAQLTSLLSTSATPNTSSAARPRPGPSRLKDDALNGSKTKSRKSNGDKADNRLSLKDAPGQDEAQTLASTRRKMQEKARLYAAMKRGDYVPKENEAAPLIDFDRKWAEAEDEHHGEHASSSGSDHEEDDNEGTHTAKPDASEIIEYEDEFGRLRRGTRAEIDRLERQRRRGILGAEALEGMAARPSAPTNVIYGDTIQTLAFVPDDADKMEALARKRDRSATPPEAKHYDADSEIRTKGAGFYKFSRDEEVRSAEMQSLDKERKETEEKRRALEEKKQARRKEIEARRRELEDRRAKKMADNFLDDLAAGYGTPKTGDKGTDEP